MSPVIFVSAALGSDYHGGYGKAGETVVELADDRHPPFVIDDFRTDVHQDEEGRVAGCSADQLRRPQEPEDAVAWVVEVHRRCPHRR